MDLCSVIKMASSKRSQKSNGTLGTSPAIKFNGFHENKSPFLIGVAGGTASGKSSVCHRIMEKLGQTEVKVDERQCAVISQDSFYNVLTEEQKAKAYKGEFNFDHPNAFDNELLLQTLLDIVAGKTVNLPVYDFVTHSRKPNESMVHHPVDVVLVEGILVFYYPDIRNIFQMKLFVDTDPDTRLSRRVLRDIKERGRDLENVLHQYTTFVKPAFEEFCLPTKKYADVIIPRGADNTVAIDLIVQHIQDLLRNSKPGAAPRTRHSSDSAIAMHASPTHVCNNAPCHTSTSDNVPRPHH